MGRVIGKQGANINSIREDSGARIDAEDKSEGECQFRIKGSPEAVQRARAMIMEIVQKAANGGGPPGGGCGGGGDRGAQRGSGGGGMADNSAVSDTLEFPVSITGGIIGSRGAKINEVRNASGAKVQIEKAEDVCRVLINGTPDQVERAKSMIRALAVESGAAGGGGGAGGGCGGCNPCCGGCGGFGGPPPFGGCPPGPCGGSGFPGPPGYPGGGGCGGVGAQISDTLEFPISFAGGIIGSRGANVNDVRLRSGCKVQVEKTEDVCRVHIEGTADQVENAKALVRQLAEEQGGAPRRGSAMDVEEDLELPRSMIGRVIGKGGETIQRLQRDSGAKLDVNTKDDRDPVVLRISGARDAIARARALVSEILGGGVGSPPGMMGSGCAGMGGEEFWPAADGSACGGPAPGWDGGWGGAAPGMWPQPGAADSNDWGAWYQQGAADGSWGGGCGDAHQLPEEAALSQGNGIDLDEL